MTPTATATSVFSGGLRFIAASLAATAFAIAMTGCVNPPGGAGGSQPDMLTASDQTEARKRAMIRLELAVGYFGQGQTEVALDELKQSIALDPNFADAHNLRGLIYMRLGDSRLAEDAFKRALTLKPRDGNVLHNYAWMLCQDGRYAESTAYFNQAVVAPQYLEQAKSYMALGICQVRAGQTAEAEKSLLHSYEMDAANVYTGFELAKLLFQRGEFQRAQFYSRRVNNTEQASAASLWLGIKIERRLDSRAAMTQLASQLKRRFPTARESAAYDRGAWDE